IALVEQHVPELAVQAGGARRITGGLELQLQQLLDHVELAELPVDAARFGQRVDQARVQLVGVLEVLERFDALKEARVEKTPQSKVKLRLSRRLLGTGQSLFERLGEAVPVVVAFQVI